MRGTSQPRRRWRHRRARTKKAAWCAALRAGDGAPQPRPALASGRSTRAARLNQPPSPHPKMLPLARVKKLIKAEMDVKVASSEAIFLIGRAVVGLRGGRGGQGEERRTAVEGRGSASSVRQGRHEAGSRRAGARAGAGGTQRSLSPHTARRGASASPHHPLCLGPPPPLPLCPLQELVLEEMVAKAHASMSRDCRKSLLYKDVGAPRASNQRRRRRRARCFRRVRARWHERGRERGRTAVGR